MIENLPEVIPVENRRRSKGFRGAVAALVLTAAAAGCGTAKAVGNGPEKSSNPSSTSVSKAPTPKPKSTPPSNLHPVTDLCKAINSLAVAEVAGSNDASDVEACAQDNPEADTISSALWEVDPNGVYIGVRTSYGNSKFEKAAEQPGAEKFKVGPYNAVAYVLYGSQIYVDVENGTYNTEITPTYGALNEKINFDQYKAPISKFISVIEPAAFGSAS